MNSDSVFQSTMLEIDNKSSALPFNVACGPDEFFGIVQLTMKKTKINKSPIFMLFTVDNTGSMSEVASGSARKIDHLKQTFVNMMAYLVTLDKEIYVQVDTFNNIVSSLIPCSLLTNDNVREFMQKIQSLAPEGCTDIGIALNGSGD